MSKTVFKPKKFMIGVPGFGAVKREDFTEEHLKACCAAVKKTGGDEAVQAFMKNHMEVAYYGDQPLFSGGEEESTQPSDTPTPEEAPKKRGRKPKVDGATD